MDLKENRTLPEILKKDYGITPETKFHNYDYLYRSILKAMEKYATQFDQTNKK